MQTTITRSITRKVLEAADGPIEFLSTRALTAREVSLVKAFGVKRYYLPALSSGQAKDFFTEFDRFWDQVAAGFKPDHPFWRNAVSSKMQEWERSPAYLALQLFTLAHAPGSEPGTRLIACASLEEVDICETWGRLHGWQIKWPAGGRVSLLIGRLVQEVRNLANFIYLCGVVFYHKLISPAYQPIRKPGKESILISSLFYPGSIDNGTYRDPFFGDLHRRVTAEGRRVTYLCAPLNRFKKCAKKIRRGVDTRIVIPLTAITIPRLLLLAGRLLIRRLRISRCDFCGCDFSQLLAWNARRHTYFNFHAEMYFAAVAAMCRRETFSRLLLPYEGNVFERACMQAFRRNNRRPVTGYAHAVVFPLNLKIRLTPVEKYCRPEPDLLLCTGPENKKHFEAVRNQAFVLTRATCSLRYIPAATATRSWGRGTGHILVALDGVGGSAAVLDWLLENADLFNDYKVIVRPHPNVPMTQLKKQCQNMWPTHFRASRDDLETDLAMCFCVIYRQTSVGMQAVINGRRAIHLNIDAPLNCDPIQPQLKAAVRAADRAGLARAIKEAFTLAEPSGEGALETARAYIANYFSAPDDACAKTFI